MKCEKGLCAEKRKFVAWFKINENNKSFFFLIFWDRAPFYFRHRAPCHWETALVILFYAVMEDSLTLTFSGTSPTLEAQYFPPIELSQNKNYVLGLVELLTFNSIPNIDGINNKFYVGEQVVSIPVESYEIEDIDKFLRKKLAQYDIISI